MKKANCFTKRMFSLLLSGTLLLGPISGSLPVPAYAAEQGGAGSRQANGTGVSAEEVTDSVEEESPEAWDGLQTEENLETESEPHAAGSYKEESEESEEITTEESASDTFTEETESDGRETGSNTESGETAERSGTDLVSTDAENENAEDAVSDAENTNAEDTASDAENENAEDAASDASVESDVDAAAEKASSGRETEQTPGQEAEQGLLPEEQPAGDLKTTEAMEILYSDGVKEEISEEAKGASASTPSVEDILSMPVIETDVTSASTDCVLVAVPGTYISDPDGAIERINQIRLEACQEGVLNPDTGEPLTTDDYVPIKWSKDLEYIARIRAAESAFTGAHARTNGKSGQSIFGLYSPDGVSSYGECIAWNWSRSVVYGIEQWYEEKKDWVDQNSGAVTGHYTQMIAPSHTHVGLGTFCSQSVGYYNTTVAEYTFQSGLDESRMPFNGDCLQILEMTANKLSSEGEIFGKLNGAPGEKSSHLLATKASYNFANSDVYLLNGVTWSSSDANVFQVSSDGETTIMGFGSAVISAVSSDGKIAGEATFSVKGIEECSIELSQTEYVYDGAEKKPSVTVTHENTVLQEGRDYTLSYSDNINAGTAKVTVTGAGGNYTGSKTTSFMIQKAPQTVTASPWTDVLGIYLTTGSTVTGFGSFTYSSSDPSIAKVESDGWLEGCGDGTAVITVTASGDENHLEGQTTFEITIKSVYEVASGPCGDNASWTYFNNGKVEISGSGMIELRQNSSGDYLWDKYYTPDSARHYKKVDTVIINEGITGIGSEMFSERQSNGIGRMSDSPVTVVIADSVTTISEKAFIHCRNMESISIGSGLKELGDYAFSYCPSLKDISVSEDNRYFTVADGALYSKDIKTLFKLPNDGRTEYSIPEGTIAIEMDAMGNLASLKSLTVPKSVIEFKEYALDGSNSLTDVFYEGTASRWATLSIGEHNDVLDAVNCHFAESEKPIGDCSVTLGQTSFIYDGTEKRPSVTVADGETLLEEGFHYQIAYVKNVNAGTADVTITGLVDYADTVSRSFTIGPASIDDAAVTGIVNRTYNGLEQTQSPTVTLDDRSLENGVDYELSYTNNIDSGRATVTITGIGNYTGTVSETFMIEAISITDAEVTGISDRTYDGSAQTQDPKVQFGGKTLAEGTDYILSYSDNTNAGTASVTITGQGNYAGTVTRTFTIDPAPIEDAAVTGIVNKTYTGLEQTQNPTVTLGDITLENGVDYELSYKNNTDSGRATVTITGIGNYTGTVSETFTIGGISIADAKVTGISDRTYDGSAQTQDPKVRVNGKTLINGTDYILSYSDNTNAGTAEVTITGQGNYADTVIRTFTINPASIADAAVTGIANRTYNGLEQTQDPTVTLGDITLENGVDYELSYTNNIDSGRATMTITGIGNYTGTVSETFTIEGTSIEDAEVTGISDRTYDGSAQTQDPEVQFGGKTLAEGTDYILSYSDNTNAGTASVTITGQGNYAGTVTRTFTIDPAPIEDAAVTGIVNKTYTGLEQTQNPTVKIGDRTLENGVDYELSYANNIDIGRATVTITGIGNYTGTVSETFTIGGISIEDAEVTGISDRTYDGSAQTQDLKIQVDGETLAEGTDYILSYSDNTNAGTASVTITGQGNYAEAVTMTFTIRPASIASAEVTGLIDQTYTGFAHTQDPIVKIGNERLLSGTDYTLSYADNINAGIAFVIVTGRGNYTDTVSSAFLISAISIADAAVTGISDKTYTGSAQTQNPKVRVGEVTLVKGTDYLLSYAGNKNAGTATVTITGKGNYSGIVKRNFKISPASIAKAAVTLPASVVWTGKALTPLPTVKLGKTTLKKGSHFTLSYKNNKNVGLASITIAGKGNYTGTVKKTFIINPKPTAISKLSAASKKFTVKWKKQASQTSGYQIQYSSRSDFKTQKTVTVSGAGKTSKDISGLVKKHRYYVRIRTFKTVGTKKYYSAWSALKTVTTK